MVEQLCNDELPEGLETIDIISDSDNEDYSRDESLTIVEDDDDLTTDGCRGQVVQNLGALQEVPTFGNVSVHNSSDVHFGNNTFFQGPVTIQHLVYAYPNAQEAVGDAIPKNGRTQSQLQSTLSKFNLHPITAKDRQLQLKLGLGQVTLRHQCVAWVTAIIFAVLVTLVTLLGIFLTSYTVDITQTPNSYDEDTETFFNVTPNGFQTQPRRLVARSGDSITLLGRAGAPISKCHFFLPQPKGTFLDFSLGQDSPSIFQYEYFGRGLEKGECGIKYNRVDDDDDGIVECKVTIKATNKLETCVTTLRVTDMSVEELPAFEIEPRTANLITGDNLTVTCNTDREIDMCHIYLPGPRYLNYDRGPESDSTPEHQYLGTGLKNGQCGVTLTGVDTRFNGYVVCKVGLWPEQVTGVWETDALKVATNRPPTSKTTQRP